MRDPGNAVFGFECICEQGYAHNSTTALDPRCYDINECVELSPCKGQAECVNTPGSYECHCAEGFYGANCQHNVVYPLDQWSPWTETSPETSPETSFCKIHYGVCANTFYRECIGSFCVGPYKKTESCANINDCNLEPTIFHDTED